MPNCRHLKAERDEAISHLGDPDWAYCYGCSCVLHKEDGKWVAQLTGVTKSSYRYG